MRFNLSWKFSRLICLGVVSFLSISSTGWSLEDAAAITRIKSAIADKDLATAVKEVRKLPMDQRMAWVDALSKLQSSKIPLSTSSSQNDAEVKGNSRSRGENAGDPVGNAGGGAMADFSTLMMLIQSVVDANWEADGGTDTMVPYANGVWVDAKGIMQPKKSRAANKIVGTKKEIAEPIALPGSTSWQTPSDLRWISLTRLQERLQERLASKEVASTSMELLGGIVRLDYLAWVPSSKEWMIGGPAGDFVLNDQGDLVHRELKLPPILLEDLLSVAPHVLGKKGVFGCSIDPQESRLGQVQQFLSDRSTMTLLSRSPDKFTQQLTDKLGPQDIKIMGLPKDSPTGLALLVADQHMKRIGLGLEPAPKGFSDYIKIAEQIGSVPSQGLVRWWFAIKPQPIETDDAGHLFCLPKNSVQVMSEKEWMDASGRRNAVVQRDEAADAFAQAFTNRFDEIQQLYPMYGRLRHILDLTVALEIVRREQLKGEVAGLEGLASDKLQPHLFTEPQQVSSIATHRKLANKQVVAIVSGGVVIQPNGIAVERVRASRQTPEVKKVSSAYPRDRDSDWISKVEPE